MARRKSKNLSAAEELEDLRKELAECDEKIKALSDKKKELQQTIEQKQMEALYQAVIKSGRTVEEVIALINADSREQQGEM